MSASRKRTILIGTALVLVGLNLVTMMIAYREDYAIFTDIFYILIGIAIIVMGVVTLVRQREDKTEFVEDIFSEPKEEENTGAMLERLLKLRNDISSFFSPDTKIANASIQEDVSQIFRNILELKKNRLTKLGIGLDFRSIHRYYRSPSIRKIRYFDGKYEIQEIKEQIEAKRRYYRGEDTILVRNDSEVAHVTIVGAKRKSDNEIVCPGCGAVSTRENLLDGCDFCDTVFTIEDLGERVSSFCLRDDYEIAYAKYKEKRSTYAYWSFIAAVVILYTFVAFCVSILMFDEETSGASGTGDGSFLDPFVMILGFVAIGGIAAAFFSIGFAILYGIFIFPLMETTANIKYNSRKKLARLKETEEAGRMIEEKIRKSDPQFSVSGFYSNLQNKLSTIIFANTKEQINAFCEGDISHFMGELENVMDFDLDEIGIDAFTIGDGLQKIDVHANTTLYVIDGKNVKHKKKAFGMRLLKNAACKTQAICEPYVLRCEGCGNSISMLDGLRCEYCGERPDIKNYDWAIDTITII